LDFVARIRESLRKIQHHSLCTTTGEILQDHCDSF
jgi:hypothetical protein